MQKTNEKKGLSVIGFCPNLQTGLTFMRTRGIIVFCCFFFVSRFRLYIIKENEVLQRNATVDGKI